VAIGVEGSLLIGTRLSSTVQHRDASCGPLDAYRCPAWLPEPGTAAYDEAKTTAFVGDVDHATIRFQHKVARDTEALTLTLTLTLSQVARDTEALTLTLTLTLTLAQVARDTEAAFGLKVGEHF